MTENKQQRPILAGGFSGTLPPAPPLTDHSSLFTHHCLTSFLFDTNKAHKIIILVRALMKTKEKQFSIRYKFALYDIGAEHESRFTSHESRFTRYCVDLLRGRRKSKSMRLKFE